MQIFNQIEDWTVYRRQLDPRETLGFVPTMGNLHRGHASLFAQSKQENDFTAVSIFVNPTQFNRADDFQHYPRTLENDFSLLEQAGVDYCLLPSEQAMYADGYRYQLQETELCQRMEGKHRPGHFNGVLTIVMKLLNWVKPHCAYFGEKDYQQYLLIRDMVTAFFMDIIIKACPTIREPSGLAYSSRNNRLTPAERSEAEKFARLFLQPSQACTKIQAALETNHIQIDYLEEYASRRYIAVIIGTIRLIDNYPLKI